MKVLKFFKHLTKTIKHILKKLILISKTLFILKDFKIYFTRIIKALMRKNIDIKLLLETSKNIKDLIRSKIVLKLVLTNILI